MDGENNEKPYYIKWMIWGVFPYFWKHPYTEMSMEVIVTTVDGNNPAITTWHV